MTIEVDTSAFDGMCYELAKMAGAPPDNALREEVGKVLSRAIELTPAASVDKIRRQQTNQAYAMEPATLYTPKNLHRRNVRNGRVLYKLTNRYPDTLWQKIQQQRNKDLKKKLDARGLAKQSWWIIGNLLGLNVSAPAYVTRAVPSTGKRYADETANVDRQEGELAYEFENSQPTINAIEGAKILQQAINGRVNYFMANVSHDVFSKMETIAKKYPGVTVE
jgi:hypothetical protein